MPIEILGFVCFKVKQTGRLQFMLLVGYGICGFWLHMHLRPYIILQLSGFDRRHLFERMFNQWFQSVKTIITHEIIIRSLRFDHLIFSKIIQRHLKFFWTARCYSFCQDRINLVLEDVKFLLGFWNFESLQLFLSIVLVDSLFV